MNSMAAAAEGPLALAFGFVGELEMRVRLARLPAGSAAHHLHPEGMQD
jgi:hypothetical protein